MSVSLEKIDVVRERTNATYEEARIALENCNEDVVEAIIFIEKQSKANSDNNTAKESTHILEGIKKLIKKGNENKLVIEKNNKPALNIPVNAAIVATVLAAPVAAVGAAAALITKHSFKVEKPDGSNSEVNKVFDKVSEVVNTASDNIMNAVHKDAE
jgi:NACalpha-BTF3-like transcription factor